MNNIVTRRGVTTGPPALCFLTDTW